MESQTVDKDEIERFSRIAEAWWDENGKFKPLHRMNPLRLRYIRDHICANEKRDAEARDSLNGLNILDIGCGGGLLCEPLARLGANVTGIDAAEKNIAVASLHAKNMGLTINYCHEAAENLAAKKEQYDAVLAMEIVEHVADVPAFITACAALVKPGGLLFMSTLNRTAKSFASAIVGAEYILRWLPRGTHDWNKFLKPSELCGEIRKTGLTVAEMRGMVFNPFAGTWSLSTSDLDINYLILARKGE